MRKTAHNLRVLRKSVDGENRSLCGRDYIVVPVVALVEGVRHAGGSPTPELVMAESFARHVETWNGRPIVVNHPVNARGVPVLAGSPEVLESSYLGDMRNSRSDDGKLLTEAWLDLTAIAASDSPQVADIWKRLVSGETIEVSVGAIVYTKGEEGTFAGKKYSGRWDIVIPDHLAFLDGGQIGACSVEDGCGTFRTQMAGHICLSEGIRMAAKSAMKTVSSGATRGTEKITAGGGGSTSSTVVIATGAAPCSCTTPADDAQDDDNVSGLASAVSRALFHDETFDMDRRNLLQRSLKQKLPNKELYVLSYNGKVVVFEMYSGGEGYKLYQLDYSSTADNEVTLGDAEPVEVMFQAKVVPVPPPKSDGKDKKMSKLTVAAKGRKITDEEDDEDEAADNGGEDEAPAKKGKGKKMSTLTSAETLSDLEKELSGTPLGKQLSQALKVASAAREKAITHILSHPHGKKVFSKDILETFDFAVLDKIASGYTLSAETTAAPEEEAEEELGLGYMEYDEEKKKAGGGDDAGAGAPAHLKGKQKPAVKKPAVTTYAGRAGGNGESAPRVPTPPDIFSFGNDGKLVS